MIMELALPAGARAPGVPGGLDWRADVAQRRSAVTDCGGGLARAAGGRGSPCGRAVMADT
jgi:hypothetical protein